MTLTLGYSKASAPSARRIAAAYGEDCQLVTTGPVDINWGRGTGEATLNRNTSTVTNKRAMREAFKAAGVPMPTLYDLDAVEFPAVGRPDFHTRKRGFWLVTNERELAQAKLGRVLRNGRRKQAATHFMEYVSPERAPREYRVHVFGGSVIRLSRKDFESADAGQHYVTVSAAGEPVSHVRDAAKAAIDSVGLDFGAVDVMASDTECWVLEVNSAPGLGGTMPQLYASKFRAWKDEQS